MFLNMFRDLVSLANNKLRNLISEVANYLSEHGVENSEYDTEVIFSIVLQIPRLELPLYYQAELNELQITQVKELAERRSNKEPLQYLTGEVGFCQAVIKVDQRALIPRYETELLVDIILQDERLKRHGLRVLDLCTGSGAIAISLAMARPDWQIEASDISTEALELAQQNAKLNQVNVVFLQSDLFMGLSGKYDLIIANPPYVSNTEYQELSAEIRLYEPSTALLAGDDGLFFYERILRECQDLP